MNRVHLWTFACRRRELSINSRTSGGREGRLSQVMLIQRLLVYLCARLLASSLARETARRPASREAPRAERERERATKRAGRSRVCRKIVLLPSHFLPTDRGAREQPLEVKLGEPKRVHARKSHKKREGESESERQKHGNNLRATSGQIGEEDYLGRQSPISPSLLVNFV